MKRDHLHLAVGYLGISSHLLFSANGKNIFLYRFGTHSREMVQKMKVFTRLWLTQCLVNETLPYVIYFEAWFIYTFIA